MTVVGYYQGVETLMGRLRIERKNTSAYHVLRHPRKDSPKPCNTLTSAVSASGDFSAIAETKSAEHTSKKKMCDASIQTCFMLSATF